MGLRGIKGAMELSDNIVQTRARLDLINDGSYTTDGLQNLIYASAQRSRGDYMNTADMVAKMGVMAGDSFSGPAEIVAFTEQLNKMYTVSGTNLAGQRAATLQLQQAMAMGVLRGQEFRSVVQQVPMLIRAVADSLGVSTGEVKKLADEGKITADVVKNAMFMSAEEINGKFESMPMTWGQVWTSMKNEMIMAAQPMLDVVNAIAQNWDRLKPIFIGVAAVIGIVAAAWGVYTVAQTLVWKAVTWLTVAANQALIVSLLANPLTWIAILVGVVIAVIYRWVQSIGNLRMAWLIAVDFVLSALDNAKIGFFTGLYFIQGLLDRMGLGFRTFGVGVQNIMGDVCWALFNP